MAGRRRPVIAPRWCSSLLPAVGFDGPSMRANAWQIQQALAAGAHGVLVCEMHSPEAGEIADFLRSHQIHPPGVPQRPIEGSRGSGSQAFAAHIWGLNGTDYLAVADTWPLNTQGRDFHGFQAGEPPWGGERRGDHGHQGPGLRRARPQRQFLVHPGLGRGPADVPAERAKVLADPRSSNALERVRLAAKKNGVQWLGTGSHGSDMNQSYDQGMRMLPGDDEKVVMASREYSKRKMPA